MKNGFRSTLDSILRGNGMLTSEAYGAVWAVGDTMWKIVNAMGYRVGQGISQSNYDYVILSEKKSTLENVILALSKIEYGCIIIFRLDYTLPTVFTKIPNTSLSVYEYGDSKYLGVLLKRKEG